MTNAACIGYCILALRQMGLTEEQISQAQSCLWEQHDFVTEEEAEEVYKKFS